ncbi:hypothetical protein DRN74_03180 [Candidatus Micrarchaeota archaeon]|nr:MAG: hypothetical protein DRN74_03180 [Candidatus Micrarchaeota archaeon]
MLLYIIAIIFLVTLILGHLFEKLRIPWLFAALLVGIAFNLLGLNESFSGFSDYELLGSLGMYFMLFLVGFNLSTEKLREISDVVVKTTLGIQVLSTAVWTLVLMAFGYPFSVALVIGLTAHCVGEAVLVPILDEFKLLNTKIGAAVIGIGVLDDVFEVAALLIAGLIVTKVGFSSLFNILASFVIIGLMVITTLIFVKTKKVKRRLFRFPEIEQLMLAGFAIFFVFLALGDFAKAEGIGAILAGIALRNLVPSNELKMADYGIRSVGYSLFGPLFFAWVGMSLDIHSILIFPMLTIAFYVIPMATKVAVSWAFMKKRFKDIGGLFAGIALSIRFSTELAVAQFLFVNKIIDSILFTAIVSSSVLATLISPALLIYVIKHYGSTIRRIGK